VADEQIVTSIVAKADLSSLVSEVHRASSSLQQLQRELLASNKAISSSTKLANNLFRDTLTGSGQFSSHFVNLNSDVDKFGKNLDAGRLKLKNYFSTFREHTTTQKGMIRELAKEQVMLQNSVLQPLGRNAQGLMQYNVMIPRGLDAVANSGKLARMEMQIMNRALSEGAGSLINWGKNTQWAGRQLTVGLTVPLTMFGAAAGKAFKEADQELVRLTKVYGGLAATSASDLKAIREEVVETAKTLSKTMGASFKDTIALGADIAATGQTGNELLGSIAETTRLAILGEVDRQDAMKATLSIQTAFKQNTQELTESINFLNAVENQTSTTLNDLVEAIPKAGPVIQQLGGDVKDLALYLTAMREGGISASEGANALKSGLASLINPTKQTVGMMSDFGIDVMGMVAKNTGDTTGLLMDLQKALDSLDPLSKARAMEQMFGKFQFARMSALLNNLGKQGSQTLQVLELMKASTADLADVASRELKMVTESASGKYKRAIEGLKAELADVGEEFLGVATKLISAATKILDFFTKLPDPIKKGLTFLAGFTALVGPLIMLTGLLANFFGYITKGVVQLRAFFMKANGWKMLTPEIIAAQKAAELVENAFYSDAAAAQVLHNALQKLVLDYQNLQAASMKGAVPVNGVVNTVAGNPVMVGGRRVVDPNDPYVGDPNTRAMSHINPRDPNKPATIFGGVPGAIPVNRGISRTPQMYMSDRLPNIEGLTSVKGISTGIVPGEAAKFHALMATLGMQTEQEVAALKKTIMMGGTVSRELLDTFDDILPITQRFADSAATQSGLIVQQMRSAEITVDQAKARIIALNAQIEADMGSAVSMYAAGRGRSLDLTRAPMMDQPVVDANGQFTLRDLYKKKNNAAVMTEFGRLRGIRTFGAPYSMQTTRMPKFNTGGDVESFSANKTVVSGPSSIGYDDRLGSVPLGGYVLNQAASMDPANAALVAMAPSTYLNDGGNITAELTPREVVFGPQIQKMPELYAAVDAANSGYSFGGQIMRGVNSYGKEMSKSAKARMKEENFKRQYREYLKFINNPRYEDDIRVRMIMLDAAELSYHNKLPINKAINIATSNFDKAKALSGGSDESFVKIRIKQVQGLERDGMVPRVKDATGVKNSHGETVYPRSTSKALNYQLNDVRAAMLNSRKFAGVHDLIAAIAPTTFLNASDKSPSIDGLHDKAHFRRKDLVGYTTSGYIGVGAVLPAGINHVMSTLETIGLSRDVLNLSSADAKENLAIALKKTGLDRFASVDDIYTALQDDGLFKSKAQIASGNVVRANKDQRNSLRMLLEAAAKRSKWIFAGRPPRPMLVSGAFNAGGVIPGGSISADRSSYGVVPPLSARLEAIRLAQQAQYAKKREADMIKYPWIKEAVAGRDRGSSVSPLLKLLAPGKQLDILEQAREMSRATATGSFKDLPPVKYGHMVSPSSGMSYPIPGVSGLYKDSDGRLKFFKGVPNEISAKAEVYGTRMAREVFGLDAPEQTIKTISNPLDPSGKSKLLGVESPFDKRFTNGGTVFNEDEMIRQTIASLVMNNKDLSPSNVYGNVLADVGAAGVFAKASGNTAHADSLPSMIDQAMINLLGVKGGARKDFAVNTAPIAAGMTAKQYNRKIKAAMKKMHPKLVKFVATLPREDRAPYIKLLQRFENGMDDATDFGPLHAVHVAAKRNSGGPIGGGPVRSGRYAYGPKNRKGSQRSGNPAKRAEEDRLRAERTASYNTSSGSGYTSSGNPQMQVMRVPYVGGSGVGGNAFGAVATGQYQQYINAALQVSQIGQPPAAVSRAFKSLTDSIKLGTVGLRYGIATSATHINSAYRDFAKSQVASARLNASFLSNWVKTNTRDIKDGILRNQARSMSAAYPGASYLMGPGQIMPVSMSGPGMVGDWQETGQDGTKSRKVGTLGYRKREYMDADGYIHDKKSAQAAGLDTKVRGGMGMGAQMGIGMAGNMGGMYVMQQEKIKMLGMEMSGMNAGLGIMAASTIIPMLPWKTMGHGIKTATTNTMAAIKAAKNFKEAISSVGAQLFKYVKILKGAGAALSVVLIGLDVWKTYNNAQQDAAMSLGITKKGAEQAGISYFNLNSHLTEYIEKQKLANAAAQGGKNNSIGMPGIPQSIEDMKKAKEEGKALGELIESINRTSTTSELQTLVNNQKAQFVAGGLSVEQANRMIYGAIANSEKATKSYELLANSGFGAITDKATAAEFAVKNLLETLKRDPKTGASKGSFDYNFYKQPVYFTKEWNEQNTLFEKAVDLTTLGIINRYRNAFADTNAYKKGVISGLESVISTFDSSTKALIGTKNSTGEVIDEYEAYQISLENLEKDMPNFNVALGDEAFKIIQEMSPELAKITNKFDSIKSILAKIKLSTSGIGLDLKYLDGELAIKLAGFTAAIDEGIEGLTKAAGDGSTYGSVGKILNKLQKSIAATSAASQKAAAATQKSIQEELKLIAKKISLIEDEKNKKLESLRATQDASNYALELQKLQIEYADAISRGDQAGAARARIEIDQLTSNRQLALTQKAIEDEADRLKAIEQKKIDAKQAKADAAAEKFEGAQDSAASATKIVDLIQGFKDTYDEITTLRITNNMLPNSKAKRDSEAQLVVRLDNLLKQIGVAGTGNNQTAKDVRSAFAEYFNKDGTVKKVYVESKPAGLPDAGTAGIVPRVSVNKDTLSIFDRDVASVTKFADQITGGKGYSIKRMTEEIVAALTGGGTYSKPINAGTVKDAVGRQYISWNTPLLNDRSAVKKFAAKKGFKPGQQFYLEEANGNKKQFLVLNDGSIQFQKDLGFASGGKVRGPGTGTSDSIPAMLSDGEYVIKASSVKKYGVAHLDAMNEGRYAEGGPVLPWWKKPKSAYNSKNQPTGSPYGRYWGELERLYQGSPLGFDRNGKPLFNNDGKDPWGGVEIPGLPFKGKVGQFSDYFHQLAEQPSKYRGPGMGLDKDPMRYAGSGASMSGIGNGVYGAGSWLTFANGGLVRYHEGGLVKPGEHPHQDTNGNFFSKFNPANAFSSMISGMFNIGASQTFNTSTNIKSTMTQQEKDRATLQAAQLISGYTSAFNLKNNTSPEIFGNQKLGVLADVLGVLPGVGLGVRGLGKVSSGAKSLAIPKTTVHAMGPEGTPELSSLSLNQQMVKELADIRAEQKAFKAKAKAARAELKGIDKWHNQLDRANRVKMLDVIKVRLGASSPYEGMQFEKILNQSDLQTFGSLGTSLNNVEKATILSSGKSGYFKTRLEMTPEEVQREVFGSLFAQRANILAPENTAVKTDKKYPYNFGVFSRSLDEMSPGSFSEKSVFEAFNLAPSKAMDDRKFALPARIYAALGMTSQRSYRDAILDAMGYADNHGGNLFLNPIEKNAGAIDFGRTGNSIHSIANFGGNNALKSLENKYYRKYVQLPESERAAYLEGLRKASENLSGIKDAELTDMLRASGYEKSETSGTLGIYKQYMDNVIKTIESRLAAKPIKGWDEDIPKISMNEDWYKQVGDMLGKGGSKLTTTAQESTGLNWGDVANRIQLGSTPVNPLVNNIRKLWNVKGFHEGGPVGHLHSNPNIGKIITGPNGGQFDFTQVKSVPGRDEQVGTGFFKIDADGNQVEITRSYNEKRALAKAANAQSRLAYAARKAARAKASEYQLTLDAIDGANPLSSLAFKTAPGLASGDKSPLMFHEGGPVGHKHKYGEPTPKGNPWYKKVGNFAVEAVKETGRSAEWLAYLNSQYMLAPYNFVNNKLTGNLPPERKFISKNNQDTYDAIAAMRAAGMNSEANKAFAMKTGLSGLNVGSLFVGGALGSATARGLVGAYGVSRGIPALETLLPTGSLTYAAKTGLGAATNLGVAATIGASKPFVNDMVPFFNKKYATEQKVVQSQKIGLNAEQAYQSVQQSNFAMNTPTTASRDAILNQIDLARQIAANRGDLAPRLIGKGTVATVDNPRFLFQEEFSPETDNILNWPWSPAVKKSADKYSNQSPKHWDTFYTPKSIEKLSYRQKKVIAELAGVKFQFGKPFPKITKDQMDEGYNWFYKNEDLVKQWGSWNAYKDSRLNSVGLRSPENYKSEFLEYDEALALKESLQDVSLPDGRYKYNIGKPEADPRWSTAFGSNTSVIRGGAGDRGSLMLDGDLGAALRQQYGIVYEDLIKQGYIRRATVNKNGRRTEDKDLAPRPYVGDKDTTRGRAFTLDEFLLEVSSQLPDVSTSAKHLTGTKDPNITRPSTFIQKLNESYVEQILRMPKGTKFRFTKYDVHGSTLFDEFGNPKAGGYYSLDEGFDYAKNPGSRNLYGETSPYKDRKKPTKGKFTIDLEASEFPTPAFAGGGFSDEFAIIVPEWLALAKSKHVAKMEKRHFTDDISSERGRYLFAGRFYQPTKGWTVGAEATESGASFGVSPDNAADLAKLLNSGKAKTPFAHNEEWTEESILKFLRAKSNYAILTDGNKRTINPEWLNSIDGSNYHQLENMLRIQEIVNLVRKHLTGEPPITMVEPKSKSYKTAPIAIPKFANGGLAQNFSNSALTNLGVPMFENGINMVPANMLAMLHKNEAVVPANMNPFNPNASAAVSGSVYNINVELNGTNVTAQDVATQIHKEMRLKEMAAGVNRRVGNQ